MPPQIWRCSSSERLAYWGKTNWLRGHLQGIMSIIDLARPVTGSGTGTAGAADTYSAPSR
ncbi:hypothetical protein L5D93_26495 [Paenibacillus thiaminolyticus]|nr:hypothetical protein [Paenibacillus thiaminolyticus]